MFCTKFQAVNCGHYHVKSGPYWPNYGIPVFWYRSRGKRHHVKSGLLPWTRSPNDCWLCINNYRITLRHVVIFYDVKVRVFQRILQMMRWFIIRAFSGSIIWENRPVCDTYILSKQRLDLLDDTVTVLDLCGNSFSFKISRNNQIIKLRSVTLTSRTRKSKTKGLIQKKNLVSNLNTRSDPILSPTVHLDFYFQFSSPKITNRSIKCSL